jgi:hypothetical protein
MLRGMVSARGLGVGGVAWTRFPLFMHSQHYTHMLRPLKVSVPSSVQPLRLHRHWLHLPALGRVSVRGWVATSPYSLRETYTVGSKIVQRHLRSMPPLFVLLPGGLTRTVTAVARGLPPSPRMSSSSSPTCPSSKCPPARPSAAPPPPPQRQAPTLPSAAPQTASTTWAASPTAACALCQSLGSGR